MNTTPKIVIVKEKKLVGMHLKMTFASNRTSDLWRSFMPLKNEIQQVVDLNLISLQIYPTSFNHNSIAEYEFEKWAAVEVSDFSNQPTEMDTFILQEGLYAVFHYRGLSTNTEIFKHIFTDWLPQSTFVLDNDRPHFEVLGEKYKNNDLTSEEDIYIPIREK